MLSPIDTPRSFINAFELAFLVPGDGKERVRAAAELFKERPLWHDPTKAGELEEASKQATVLKEAAPALEVLSRAEGDAERYPPEFVEWVLSRQLLFSQAEPEEFAFLSLWPGIRSIGFNAAPFEEGHIAHMAALRPGLEGLVLPASGVKDKLYGLLPRLRSLRSLTLGEKAPMTEAHVPSLLALGRLRELRAKEAKIKEPGWADLGAHPALETVQARGIGDEGFIGLMRAPRLASVEILAPRVTDAGLEAVRPAAARLRELRLGGVLTTKITDEGAPAICAARRLEKLDLSESRITDRAVEQLSGLEHLTELDLGGTPITDASVPSLCKLTKLTRLRITGTRITPVGIGELSRALGGRNLLTRG